MLSGHRGIGIGIGVSFGFGRQIGQVNMSKGRILSHIRERKL